MKVNRTNYEVWMIDYFDGKLNAVETAELMAFIDKNPDIKIEFENFEDIGIEPGITGFTRKNQLKRDSIIATENINEENYEEFFVAYHEGDLNENQTNELFDFVDSNPVLETEFQFHQELFIAADSSVIFEQKTVLKRKAVIGIYWQISAAAAIILLLFGLFGVLDFSDTQSTNEIIRVTSLNKIRARSITTDFTNRKDGMLIEKQIQFASTDNLESVLPEYEQLTISQLKQQSPDLSIHASKDDIRYDELLLPYNLSVSSLTRLDESKPKKAFGRVIQNLAGRLAGNLPESKEEELKTEPSFVKALGTSITVFNTITGADTELVKSYDQDGKLTGYYVEGETIAWRREISPNGE